MQQHCILLFFSVHQMGNIPKLDEFYNVYEMVPQHSRGAVIQQQYKHRSRRWLIFQAISPAEEPEWLGSWIFNVCGTTRSSLPLSHY